MAMPKAAVDHNHSPARGKRHVRPSRQVFAMKPEAVSKSMGNPSDEHFRFSVFGADERHPATTFRMNVRPICGTLGNFFYHYQAFMKNKDDSLNDSLAKGEGLSCGVGIKDD